MKKVIIAACVIACTLTSLNAQQAPKEFNFHMTNDEISMVSDALSSLPYSKVAALMAKLRAQYVEQTQQAPNVPQEPEKKD